MAISPLSLSMVSFGKTSWTKPNSLKWSTKPLLFTAIPALICLYAVGHIDHKRIWDTCFIFAKIPQLPQVALPP